MKKLAARFCHENSIPFEFKMVDLGKGENKTKEFVDLNPNKTVPVLNDNGFVLYERFGALHSIFVHSFFFFHYSHNRDFRFRCVEMLMVMPIVPPQRRDLVLLGSTIQGTTPHPTHKSFKKKKKKKH